MPKVLPDPDIVAMQEAAVAQDQARHETETANYDEAMASNSNQKLYLTSVIECIMGVMLLAASAVIVPLIFMDV